MSDEIIQQLEHEWRTVDELCASLTDDEWDTPTDLPGWTVRDNVAHMIGTERMLAGDPAPAATAPGEHVRNPIGEANEAWVAHYRDRPGAEVLEEFRQVTAARLATLRAMSPDDWAKEGFTPEGPGPYAKFMAIRVFDCWEHEQDIRRAVGRPGHLEGPIAEMAIDKVVASAGYVVGKKAGAPEGTT
ncbi:MAG TPA: maleylpyruvate isomerase family mycothiol-dependent enzyme, partial [Acidimicrobiales bacterium]|nr:maleylpyruvate isomerase family mycothiol-dependent enzyme [Acidimicrobiales bacterium]